MSWVRKKPVFPVWIVCFTMINHDIFLPLNVHTSHWLRKLWFHPKFGTALPVPLKAAHQGWLEGLALPGTCTSSLCWRGASASFVLWLTACFILVCLHHPASTSAFSSDQLLPACLPVATAPPHARSRTLAATALRRVGQTPTAAITVPATGVPRSLRCSFAAVSLTPVT